MATWREEPDGQRRAAVLGEPARCGREPREVGTVLPQEMLRWAASAQPQWSEAPGAGQAYSAAPPQQLPGTAARAPARHDRALEGSRFFSPAFPALPGSSGSHAA